MIMVTDISTIEVFKTDVYKPAQAAVLTTLLLHHFPGSRISFDLDDCDKVLRVQGVGIDNTIVTALVVANGFCCTELE